MSFWTQTKPSKLFNKLKDFEYILVTGPQRSGTTIMAVMIANDLGYEFIEEGTIWGRLQWQPPDPPAPRDFTAYFQKEDTPPAVIHCPEHSAYCHLYAGFDNVAVVMVRRDIDDIIASQERVGWGFEWLEMKHYPGEERPISRVKYKHWDDYQKKELGKQAFEIEYESLKKHPMWVDKSERNDFAIAQVEVGKPRGDRVQNPKLAK